MDSERSMSQLNLYPNASTIDAVNDELVIWTNSLSAVQNINRNTFLNLASQPVGLSDSQTLTNKTLTSPTINGATLSGTLSGTYTIGGTPTFPSSVTQNTVVQTLTNKTLTSPTINSPTITNATISADTLTGYTVSNTGTIYGIPVTTGTMSGTYLTSGTVTATQLGANAVLSGKLGLSSSYTGGVASFTNTGTAGGTIYWINLGGLRIAWSVGMTSNAASWLTVNWTTVGFTSTPIIVANAVSQGTASGGWVEWTGYATGGSGSPNSTGASFLTRYGNGVNSGTTTINFFMIGT